MIGQTISHYKILEKLGEGGMGVVYKAHDTKLNRTVALKFLPPHLASDEQDKGRFLREARAASSLDHPNICTIHEIDETPDGRVFIAMTLYEGTPLNKKIEEGPLKIDEALDIAGQVAEGLQAAHERGVVHRDIKSSNIIQTDKGRAVIMDFGLAQSEAATKLTKTGSTLGTVPYMSPEQARGEKVDHRTDIWSLGIVLYEMVAGRLPFRSEYSEAIVYSILNKEPPPLTSVRSDVPMELESIVNKCLQKSSADRYQHADELLVDLRHVKAGPGKQTTPRSTRRDKAICSIAVLPLENLSGDPRQEYFADGITDALITELGKISALTVPSRTSVIGFKGSRERLPEIARKLNVDAIFEGSVVREDGQVRINARLIDGRTEGRLWTETYDRDVSSILALYAELARTIAGAIGATLTPQDTLRLVVTRSVDPQAYDEYMRGMQQVWSGTASAAEEAIGHFHRAIELDPTFAEPHASLVEAYWMLTGFHGTLSPNESAPLVKAAAERAVALDPGSATAHALLAHVRSFWEWRWKEAEDEYRRALELNPGLMLVHLRYSNFLPALGRYDEAIQHALRAAELDPGAGPLLNLAWLYFHAGRIQETIVAAEASLKVDSSPPWAHLYLGWSYSALGRHPDAIEAIDPALRAYPQNQFVVAVAVVVYARGGRQAEAHRFLDALLTLDGKDTWVDPYYFGYAHAWLGETDVALDYFKRSVEEHSLFVWVMKVEWLPEGFTADPRFRELLRRVNLAE